MEHVFTGFGIEIFKRDEKLFVRVDSGGSVSYMIEKEITEEEAAKAQKSEKDAYEMLIAREHRP